MEGIIGKIGIGIIALKPMHFCFKPVGQRKSLDAGNIAEGILLKGHDLTGQFLHFQIVMAHFPHHHSGQHQCHGNTQ